LRELMPDLTDEEVARTDFGTYGEDQFFDDMARVTENRTDPDLVELLVRRSRPTMMWLRARAFASCRSTAGRLSRSTGDSSSGAD